MPRTSDRGNEAVRGVLYGIGISLLLWNVVAWTVVLVVVLFR